MTAPRSPLRALVETWVVRARKMRQGAKDTVVEPLIAQRADAFIECALGLEATLAFLPDPRPWMQHKAGCVYWYDSKPKGDCTCGLATFLAAWEGVVT